MTTTCKRCLSDDEISSVSQFILKNRRDLHPAYTTLDMVALLYSYITEGNLVCIVDENQRVLGASAYYLGTRERNFEDKEIVFADLVICDRTIRGSRLFMKGFIYLIELIVEEHPEVREIQFSALSENTYVCNLYAKLANKSHTREGLIGEETVFSEQVSTLKTALKKFQRVSW
ncbi:hypothetical protein JFN88_03300 [Paenibacillus sp. MAHUQ-46]|uniref:Uncharacterized protein n=1 Tax=Paenibacillus roseus TaxID=2798579 RepID=A0A934J2N7_9BACL|nr:hypothetical protein [Paenibacillus roseus]MBJ6360348.1 hypothetical protein [Paenibacillus roseus]